MNFKYNGSLSPLCFYTFKIFAFSFVRILIHNLTIVMEKFVISCYYTAKEPRKRNRVFAKEKMTKIRYDFGRHPVRRYFWRAHISLKKFLMNECTVKPCIGACMYICMYPWHTNPSYDLCRVYFVSLATDVMQSKSRFLSRVTSIH